MPRKTRPDQPCSNCPKPQETVVSKPAVISHRTEGKRLWKHVAYGAGTIVSMMEGYSLLNMPDAPLDSLRELRDRLTKVIHSLESTLDVADPPS